jgi:hypothetical protein
MTSEERRSSTREAHAHKVKVAPPPAARRRSVSSWD